MSFVSPEMQSVDDPLCTGFLHLLEGHIALQAVPHSQHFAALLVVSAEVSDESQFIIQYDSYIVRQ